MINLILVLAKTAFLRKLRKMQRKAILPMLLECSMSLNTCMQYAVSFLAVKITISTQIFGVLHVNKKKIICRMFHFCVTVEALPLLLQK